MTLGERIRDHLRQHASLSCAQAMALFGATRKAAYAALYAQRDAGVIVPIPGRYPRHYRIARLEGCHE